MYIHTHLYIYVYICIYTHMQEVALSVKEKDSFIILVDLCLTCVFASVCFIFTIGIIFASQHISKHCYVDSYLLCAQKCKRLTTPVSKWSGLDLAFFCLFILQNVVPKSIFKQL